MQYAYTFFSTNITRSLQKRTIHMMLKGGTTVYTNKQMAALVPKICNFLSTIILVLWHSHSNRHSSIPTLTAATHKVCVWPQSSLCLCHTRYDYIQQLLTIACGCSLKFITISQDNADDYTAFAMITLHLWQQLTSAAIDYPKMHKSPASHIISVYVNA